LSLNPEEIFKDIMNFYGLAFDSYISEFIKSHTKVENEANIHNSTIRDSKSSAFHWTKTSPYANVAEIQSKCRGALELWGYKEAKNESELLNDFIPIVDFHDFD
jgi:hypothetical protein